MTDTPTKSQKNVRFDYFETFFEKKDGSIKGDISSIFDKIINEGDGKYDKYTKPFRDEKARIQKIEKNENNLYEIQFLRLREFNLPGIADDAGDYETIKLDNNEYIGESTAALYDSEEKIFVMQRNLHAFTPSGIGEYISMLIKKRDKTVSLNPIIADSNIDAVLSGDIYRSINLKVSSNVIDKMDEGNPLSSIIKGVSKYDGSSIEIKIGVGRAPKRKSLNKNNSRKLINWLFKEKDTEKIKVKYKENESTKIEEVDLLEDRRHDNHTFEINKRDSLEYDNVIEILKDKYLERKENNDIY